MTTTNEPRDRMGAIRRARETIERARAERAERERRRADLVAASCRICGAPVRAGEGTRDPWPTTTPAERAALAEAERAAPAGADAWRREHADCAAMDAAMLLSAVLGEVVTAETAANLRGPLPLAHRYGRTSDRPWSWLTADERADLAGRVRQARARTHAHRCTRGACGLCGVATARRWVAAPDQLRWPDGTLTALCGDCYAVWGRRGGPTDRETLRLVVVEAATGWIPPMGHVAGPEVRAALEASNAPREGTALAWTYSERIAEMRDRIWSRHPDAAPVELRADYERRAREAEAAEAARIAAEEAAARIPTW